MNNILMILLLMAALSVGAADELERGTFVDQRDGQTYPTVRIGSITWFASNLNYAAPGSFCYQDVQKNCDARGRLYRWEASLAACPSGWHSSTDYEWQHMESVLGMTLGDLGTINARGTDQGTQLGQGGKTGFNYALSGYRNPAGKYEKQEQAAAIWNANESDFATAWHRDLRPERSGVWRSRVNKEYALSVRCVQDIYSKDRDDWN